jgi:hypothetical protein
VRTRIKVATATLFRSPTTDRPADAPALAEVTDVRRWVAQLDDAERMRPAVVTQALLGEDAWIEERRDGWARVVLAAQPADDLDPRGYPGWLPLRQLAPADPPQEAGEYVVAVTATTLRDAPEGDLVLPAVVLGTRLSPAPFSGWRHHEGDEWRPVCVPGSPDPLWARTLDLATAATTAVTSREVLKTATMLREVVYVWGGLSPFGIDCSGLVHLAWRRHGVVLPRDTYNQATVTTPITFGEERPGDLYFFARPGEQIHHVGLVAATPRGDTRVMLHACATNGRVVVEEIEGERAETLVAAHRVPLPTSA